MVSDFSAGTDPVLLPAAIGLRRAKEMSTTGNFLDAPTALTWGLVNHVVAHEDLATARVDEQVAVPDLVAHPRALVAHLVGADAVQAAVLQPVPQSLLVALRLERWIGVVDLAVRASVGLAG